MKMKIYSLAFLLLSSVSYSVPTQRNERGLPTDFPFYTEMAEEVTRRRRAIIFQDAEPMTRTRRKIDHESEGTFVIQQVDRASPQYYDSTTAVDINCQKIKDKTFVFSIEDTVAGREVMMHQLNDRDLDQRLLSTISAPGAVSVDVFNIKDQLFAFTTVNHEPQAAGSSQTIDTGSTLYQVTNPSSSKWTFEKAQTIHLPFAKSSALWTGMGEEANEMFLALAPEKVVVSPEKTSYAVTVPVYRWQGGYFDYVSQLPASNPQNIQHFAMFSHDYLAVANYQDDTGSTSVHSEIFKYNHKDSRFVSFQRVQTYGAKDIRHFTFSDADERRQEHFIAIANSCKRDESGKPQYWVQSNIMKMGGTRFLPLKSFYSYGAQQFLPVKDDSKFFLVLADFHSLRVFQYNGWTFVETYSKKFEEQHDITSPFSISMRQLNGGLDGKSYFTVASSNQHVKNGMFGVSFETRNDHRKLVTSVEAWCNGATNQVKNKDLVDLEQKLNAAPKVTDSRVMIKGTLRFDKGLKIGQLKSQTLRMGRGRSLDHDKFRQLAKMEREFKSLSLQAEHHHQDMLNNVVWVNSEEPQEIKSRVHFSKDVDYKNERLEVRHLQVKDKMGSVQVQDHLDNVIFLNQPQKLKSVVTDTLITNDAALTTLNGLPLSDYALVNPSSDKQVFTGNNEFKEMKVTREVQVGNNFAGLSFVQPEFLLYDSNQTFPGATMQLSNSKVNKLYTRELNGVDVFTMFADAVPLSGGVIKSSKRFVNSDNGVRMKNAKVTTVNDENISSLYDNAIYVTGPAAREQSFTTPVHFESMEIESISPMDPNINDEFDVNLNFFKVAGGEYTVKDVKFMKPTNIDELFVESQLNNVKVLQDTSKLDLLLMNPSEVQHVKSKVLKSVHLTQNTEATELVDGMDLAGWSHEQKIELSENSIQGALNLVSGHVVAEKGVIVGKSFKQENQDVARVLQNSARLDAETLPGNCDLHFDSLRVMGNSDIRGMLNQVQPSQWVVNSEKATLLDITAEKVFQGSVHLVKDVSANGLYGRLEGESERENLVAVYPTLLLNGTNQVIMDEMAFGGLFRADQASCPNAILDKVPFENLLLKQGDQTVEVETTFRQPLKVLGDVQVERDLSAELVNGFHLRDQLKNTLMTDGQFAGGVQKIKGAWQFDHLTVTDATQVAGSVASSDVQTLYGDIIRKDSEVIQLEGLNLAFEKGAVIQRAEYIGRLNGISSTDWGNTWLLSRSDQVVETKVEFARQLSANAVNAPNVNGVDINQMSENILRIDRDESLDASSVNFQGPVTAQSGVSMPNGANVNGIDLARDVLFKNSNEMQTVTAEKTFKNGATVKGNLFVNEMSGFDIANFANLISNQAKERAASSSPSSLRIKGNLKAEKEPAVATSINGHSWDALQNEIWMRGRDVVLENPVKFNSVKLQQGGSMGESATLNGLDLNQFEKNYASKTRPQKWTGQVTLENVENANTLTAKSLVLENGGKFNDVDLQSFYESVLRYSGDQDIVANGFTAESLVVNRLDGIGPNNDNVQINSVNVKEDMMTHSGPNIVTVAKKMKNLKARNMVLSNNTVLDGVNLGAWNDGAVTRTGNHEIQGPLSFESLETTENVVVDGTVDQMQFDLNNLLTTDKDQVVPNRVILKQSSGRPAVKAPAVEFKGKLNGINVQDSFSKMVFKDNVDSTEPIVIKGGTVFNAPVAMSQVKTEDLLHGQNVTALMNTMSRAHEEVESKAFNANQQYSELLRMTKRMLAVSEKRAQFLDYYVLTQKIQIAAAYVKVLRNVGYPAIAVGYKQSDLITTENWWSYSTAVDYYQLQIGNRVQLEGIVTDIAELPQGGSNMFAFAVNNESSDRPAQAALEVINSNNVQSVEINKSPDKLSKTFVLKSVDVGTPNMRPAISQVIYSHGFKSVKSFSLVTNDDSLTSCMAATTERVNELDNSLKIYCMNKVSEALEVVQEMHLESPSLMTTTKAPSSDSTLLAILTRSQDTQPEGLLEIWSHTRQSMKRSDSIQFSKQSCLPVFNAISVDSMTTEDGKAFLAVASGALRGREYQGSVFIYRFSSSQQQFKKVQTVEVKHPMDVKFQHLKPSNEVVMYVLSESVTNNVQVYKRQGLSGWSLVHQFTSENGKSLEVADFTMDGVYRAQVLVTSPTQTSIYAAEFMGINTVIEEELMEQTNEISTSLRDFDNL